MPPGQNIYRPICLLAAAAILVPVLVSCKRQEEAAKKSAPRPPVPVVVATVSQRTIPVQVRAIGNVEPYSTISVKALIGGELQKVFFTEGEMVKKGQKLFLIDPRPQEETIRQLEANLAKDTAQAENAQADAGRYAALFKEGVVAKQQYELSAANASAMQATLAADRAAISNAKLQLEYCTIYSPVDGRTGNLMVKEGNVVKANDIALVTINQIEPIYVTFSVPEKELAEIRRRMDSSLPVQATIGADPAAAAMGRLTFIDNAVDQTTGTIKMKGTFANADHRLWPGQFVNVTLTVSQQANAILAPSQAVQVGQKGQYVYVVGPGNKAEMRIVNVGAVAGGDIAITGVHPGEMVVTDGQSRLMPGAVVQVINKNSGAAGQ